MGDCQNHASHRTSLHMQDIFAKKLLYIHRRYDSGQPYTRVLGKDTLDIHIGQVGVSVACDADKVG